MSNPKSSSSLSFLKISSSSKYDKQQQQSLIYRNHICLNFVERQDLNYQVEIEKRHSAHNRYGRPTWTSNRTTKTTVRGKRPLDERSRQFVLRHTT